MRGPLVLVFVQTGCGACEEYMQRFDRIAPEYQKRGVTVQLGDLARSRNAIRMADRFKIEATPTTIGLTRTGNTVRLEGSVENRHIKQMFDTVVE